MRLPSSRWRWLVAACGLGLLAGALFWVAERLLAQSPRSPAEVAQQEKIPAPFSASRAEQYLAEIVAIGPRQSGSTGMAKQQQLLLAFFSKQGGAAELQKFPARDPLTGKTLELANLIVRFRPQATKRYLLCAHYDTRPYPDEDKKNPRGLFVGANDGGSGVAALMEMSHHLSTLPESIGVDFVLFDGEELVYDSQRDPYFLGSTHFARTYAQQQQELSGAFKPYEAGVLLDMIGDRELQIFYEQNSWNYARKVTLEIWGTAERLGIRAFQPRIRHTVRDDHLPLNEIARIPTTDLIDFDYPRPGFRQQSYWHTTADTIDKCSGHSLVSVIYVLHTWLKERG